jgi:nitroreductase
MRYVPDMDFETVIKRRRSVRTYRQDTPPTDLVDRIVDVARRVPTAGFSQGIDFLVLDSREAVDAFWAMTTHPAHDLDEAARASRPPVLIVMFSDPGRYLTRYSAPDKAAFGLQDPDRWPVKFWDIDAAMAAMQLQLAAVNEGLDTWFFGVAHGAAAMRDHFGVPDDRSLIGIIGLGYRTDDEVAFGSGISRPRRPLEEQLHRNGW